MFEFEFYKDKNGYSETAEWIMELEKKLIIVKNTVLD